MQGVRDSSGGSGWTGAARFNEGAGVSGVVWCKVSDSRKLLEVAGWSGAGPV